MNSNSGMVPGYAVDARSPGVQGGGGLAQRRVDQSLFRGRRRWARMDGASAIRCCRSKMRTSGLNGSGAIAGRPARPSASRRAARARCDRSRRGRTSRCRWTAARRRSRRAPISTMRPAQRPGRRARRAGRRPRRTPAPAASHPCTRSARSRPSRVRDRRAAADAGEHQHARHGERRMSIVRRGARRRHSRTARVAERAPPARRRPSRPERRSSARGETPALRTAAGANRGRGSLPQSSHHHAEARSWGPSRRSPRPASDGGDGGTAMPRMKNGPKPDDDTPTRPATAPEPSRRSSGPS